MFTIRHNASLAAALHRWRIAALDDIDDAIITADQVLYELRRRDALRGGTVGGAAAG